MHVCVCVLHSQACILEGKKKTKNVKKKENRRREIEPKSKSYTSTRYPICLLGQRKLDTYIYTHTHTRMNRNNSYRYYQHLSITPFLQLIPQYFVCVKRKGGKTNRGTRSPIIHTYSYKKGRGKGSRKYESGHKGERARERDNYTIKALNPVF